MKSRQMKEMKEEMKKEWRRVWMRMEIIVSPEGYHYTAYNQLIPSIL